METKTFRLILSQKNDAPINMATDEALALCFKENDTPILRLYSWEHSVTLGVAQKIEEYQDILQTNTNFAKRITGGGVLFHGHDLSYSLILPASYLENLNVKESYEKICSFLLSFYKDLGLNAHYLKDDPNLHLSKSAFCQVGFEAYDIVIDGKKIGGNAQRRTKKFIFQHGSIPIENNEKLLENKEKAGYSLIDFGVKLSYDLTQELLQKAFEKTFQVRLKETPLNTQEKEKLQLLLKEKYDYTNSN